MLFTNEKTKEFIKYQFALKCSVCEPLQKYIIETAVRDGYKKNIQIQNMFQRDVTFVPRPARYDIHFSESSFNLNAKSVSCATEIEFKPLVPCENVDQLLEFEPTVTELDGKQVKLANVQIMLQLSATPPRPSSPVRVQADLGKTLNFQISLMNETKDKLTFVQAVTMQNDVKALYKQLSQT